MTTVDVQPLIERQRVGRFWIGLFVVCVLVTFLDGFDFQTLSFAGRYIQKAYTLTDTQFGTLGTVGVFGTLIGGLCLGYLGDRAGRRPSIIVAVTGFGLLTLGIVLATNYGQLLVFRFLAGFFLGGALPPVWVLATEFAPARFRSTSVVITMVGAGLGSACGGPVSNLLIPHYGWRSVFIAGGVASLLALIPVVLVLPESVKFLAQKDRRHDRIARIMKRVAPRENFEPGTRFVAGFVVDKKRFTPAELFRNKLAPLTVLLWTAYTCTSAVAFYLAFWGPILNERLGFSVSAAVTLAAVTGVVGALGPLPVGRFVDKWGVRTLAAMPALAVPCLLFIGFVPLGRPGYVIVLLVLTFSVAGGQIGMHSIAGIFYRPAIRADGAAWAASIAKTGSMFGPLLAGAIMDNGFGPQGTFYAFAVFPVAMAVLLVALGRRQRRLPPEADGALASVIAEDAATKRAEAAA
ncbi:MFS transporter [Amycolatopsis pigmentata]|uniref:MFS transporter n=1 Tax=Amycolatopsis pigmentata TaxID=450801 RepID=A0ABW5G1V1_9PSEU